MREENAVFKQFFTDNKGYTENMRGSMAPEHVRIETSRILQDMRQAVGGETNFLEQGMNHLNEVVIENCTKKNEAVDRMVRAQLEKQRLIAEFEAKYANDEVLKKYYVKLFKE